MCVFRRNVFRRRRRVNRVRKRAERSGERNEAKDAREYFLDGILFRVYTDTLNSKQARPRERDATENFDAFD